MSSRWIVIWFGHEPLDLLANVFEDFFDRPALFNEFELVFREFDRCVNFEVFPLLVFREGFHGSPSLDNVGVEVVKRVY